MVSGERQCLDRDPGFCCDPQAVPHGGDHLGRVGLGADLHRPARGRRRRCGHPRLDPDRSEKPRADLNKPWPRSRSGRASRAPH